MNKDVEFIKTLISLGYYIYRQWEAAYPTTFLGGNPVWIVALFHDDLSPIRYEIRRKELSFDDLSILNTMMNTPKE